MSQTKAKSILITILLMLVSVIAAFIIMLSNNSASAYADSELGSQANPYVISTAEQLKQLSDEVEDGNVDGYNGSYFVLANDIDMSSVCAEQTEGWDPIGDYLCRFSGSFDGNGHSITNLYISRPNENYIGLFSILDEAATVKNLTVYGTVIGKNNTGGIAGQNYAKIQNCISYVSVSNDQAEMAMNVGGIVGYNDGIVTGCGNFGNVDGNLYFAGGVVGINNGTVTQCFNSAEVTTSIRYGGGVVGMNSEGATVSEAFNSGIVSVDGNYSGGVVGGNDGTVTAVYNSGSVTATDYVGGVCGTNSGVIEKSYNRSAAINGRVRKGAISGNNAGTISDCFNAKSVYSACVDCTGIEDFDLSLPTVLAADGKMNGLTNGTDIAPWIKRDFDGDRWYMPEIAFLGNNDNPIVVQASKDSTAVARVEVAASSVAVGETNFIYDGTEHKPEVYFNGVIATENEIYSRQTSNGVNAGAKNGASVEISFINFYKGSFTFYFTVAQKEIEIVWTKQDLVYNGAVQMPTVDRVIGSVPTDQLTFEYVTQDGISANKHTVTAVLPNSIVNNNYYIKDSKCDYKINKSELTVKATNETEYNGKAQAPSLEIVSGRVGEENIVFRVENWQRNIVAGNYSVNLYLADNAINSNYNLSNNSIDYTINKKSATIRWSDDKLTYNGKAQHPSAFIDGLVDGEKVKLSYSEYANNIHANSGYTVYAEPQIDSVSKNYDIERSECVYDIAPSTLSLVFSDKPLIYNGLCQYPTFTVDGLVGGDLFDIELSDYSNNVNATAGRDYSVTIDLSVTSDYEFSAVTKTYGIQPMPITVKWTGKKLVYNGSVQRPNAVVANETPDDVNLIYSNYSGKDAGSNYTIEITSASSNYVVTNTLTYDILPYELIAVWDCDTFTYDGTVHVPTATLSSGLNGETIGFDYDSSQSVRAGAYQIHIVIGDNNYSVTNANFKYEILKKTIEIVGVSAEDKRYDGKDLITLVNGRLVGIENGDTVSFVLGSGHSASENVGTHAVATDITLTGKDSDCYWLIQPEVNVEITKAVCDSSEILFPSKTFAYDGKEKSIYVSSDLPTGLGIEYIGNKQIDIGKYTVTVRFIDRHSNYEPISDISAIMYISCSEYIDATHDITLNVVDGYIDYGAVLKIDNVDEIIDRSELGENQRLVRAYDISLNQDGYEIQPNGLLKISVAVDGSILKNKGLTLLHKKGDEYEKIEYEIDGDRLVFYTDSLSVFVITTKKQSPVILIASLSILCLTVFSVVLSILIFKKKHVTSELNID